MGATETLKFTEVVIAEVGLYETYVGRSTFNDVNNYMEKKGFKIFDIVGLHQRPLDNSLFEFDAIYIKKNSNYATEQSYI